jgi:hypothetical protein
MQSLTYRFFLIRCVPKFIAFARSWHTCFLALYVAPGAAEAEVAPIAAASAIAAAMDVQRAE